MADIGRLDVIEDRLVGIASFSDYPPEASKEKPRVGGIINVDVEKIYLLKPDLLLSPPGVMAGEKLSRLGVRCEFVPNKTLDDIASSFSIIGRLVDRADGGRSLENKSRASIDEARRRVRSDEPVRVLVVIGYTPLWVAGGYGFLNELVEAAGGQNVAARVDKDFYAIDMESVIAARPQVIVDLTLEDVTEEKRWQRSNAFWSRFRSGRVLKDARVVFVKSDLLTIPGPRLIEGLAALEKLLHPAEEPAGGAGDE